MTPPAPATNTLIRGLASNVSEATCPACCRGERRRAPLIRHFCAPHVSESPPCLGGEERLWSYADQTLRTPFVGAAVAVTDRRIAALAGRQHGVVAARQLFEVGISRTAINRRAADGLLRRIHRGVYAFGPL